MLSRDHFKNKRIAIIGLGAHGEMLSDIKFLIKSGALVSVYDLRSEARLKDYLLVLREAGLASHICGSVPEDDLLDMDFIILSHEYPRNSSFLAKAEKAGIVIEYPETLFFRQAPPITLIGIMGACGKSTVLSMLAPLLEKVFLKEETPGRIGGLSEGKSERVSAQNLFIIDPDGVGNGGVGGGAISYLKKIKSGDVVVARLTDALMKELCNLRLSPHIAVFTSTPPHGAFMESPFEILSHQTYNNFVIAGDDVIDKTHVVGFQPKAKMLRTKPSLIPVDWVLSLRGQHDRENMALAMQVARLFKLNDDVIQSILEQWKPLKGRLELVKKVKQVEFYNDTASISPYSTEVAVMTLGKDRNIVLILGGVDNGYDYRMLFATLPQYVRALVIVPGSGTLKERASLQGIDSVKVLSAGSLEEAVVMAMDNAQKGDCVLFSPGFGAGGLDRSRKERGERFVKAVRGLVSN
jgi:UDP-N-acetylmuramoylalanine-D-glutamate ligase